MANPPDFGMSIAEPSSDPSGLMRVRDEELIREFLMRDRYANAYLLGKLDPLYAPFCKWYATFNEEGSIRDLLLLYQGLSLPVGFLVADPSEDPDMFFQAALQTLPGRFHFHIVGEHMSSFRRVCEVSSCKNMRRMGLQRHDYKRVEPENLRLVERLGHRDTAAIMSLYQHYPDHFFEPYQLEAGLYFGVRDQNEILVSIAGIHVVSKEHDVAVIGNLVTHPTARGRGLATSCTRALLDELFERVSFVALNVQDDNQHAIKMYSNFGFSVNNTFFEGRSER